MPGTTTVVTADAGDPSKIAASIGCTGTLDNTAGFQFSYTVDQFANGNVFASGSVASPAAGSSSSAFFAPSQTGFATATVSFILDAAGPSDGGWWTIALDRTSLVVTITYHDVDVDGGTDVWTEQPSQCVVNHY